MTTVLLTVASDTHTLGASLALLVVLAVVLLLTLGSLLLAPRIMQLMGETGANVITRILGIVLAALAIQFVLDGLGTGLPAASILRD